MLLIVHMLLQPLAVTIPISPEPSTNPYLPESQTLLNRIVVALRLKRVLHWANTNFFHEYACYSRLPPYSYQLPGRYYRLAATQNTTAPDQAAVNPEQNSMLNMRGQPQVHGGPQEEAIEDLSEDEQKEFELDRRADGHAKRGGLKYLDIFRRKSILTLEDRRLDPVDGQLSTMVVQATSEIYDRRNKTTWRRTYIENVSSYIVRLAYWPTSGGFDKTRWQDWLLNGLRWIVGSIALLIVVCFNLFYLGHT